MAPQPSGTPQPPSAGHFGTQQRPMVQRLPFSGQPQVPPQPSAPPQLPSTGQLGTQQRPWLQGRFSGQPQVPPQPSSPPQVPSTGHLGTQHLPLVQRPPLGQPHLPPQPLSPPQVPSVGHLGTHTQRPCTQRPAPGHGGVQAQVSTHWPLLHWCPAGQVTLAHESGTQALRTQTWPAGQVTPAHSSGGAGATQASWHTVPAGHWALHGRAASHLPVAGLQSWLAAHLTPAQATAKQPGMQVPPTQVWLAGHATFAHGSAAGTHEARHWFPPRQTAGVQGSA
jgi:hypothetical protein